VRLAREIIKLVLPGNLAIGIVQASTYKEQNSNKQQQQTEGTFGFFDVDFDGQDELIYVAYGQGHHGCTAFRVFELDGTEREDEPFDWSVDEYTEFDRREKSITVHQYGGLSDGGNIVKFKRQPDGSFHVTDSTKIIYGIKGNLITDSIRFHYRKQGDKMVLEKKETVE